nr:hypothetical protein [Vibrio metschnikovii]
MVKVLCGKLVVALAAP